MDFEEFLNFMAAVKTTSQEEGAGAGQRAAASAAQSGADKVAKLRLREWRSRAVTIFGVTKGGTPYVTHHHH